MVSEIIWKYLPHSNGCCKWPCFKKVAFSMAMEISILLPPLIFSVKMVMISRKIILKH